MIVTAALAGPSAMSGSDTGLATSDALLRHRVGDQAQRREPGEQASPVSDRAAVKARRVMINGLLPDWRVHAQMNPKQQGCSLA